MKPPRSAARGAAIVATTLLTACGVATQEPSPPPVALPPPAIPADPAIGEPAADTAPTAKTPATASAATAAPDPALATIAWGLVVHGGAGMINRGDITPALEREYRDKMAEAMRAGWAVLRDRGSRVDAVVATINVLEDSPLFNAGKGAARQVVMGVLEKQAPNTGGVIGLDLNGNVVAVFNTPGMFRGWIGPDGKPTTAIYP